MLQMVGLLTTCVATRVGAQLVQRCDASARVRAVEFSGSPHFDATTLAATIVTPSPTFAQRVLHFGSLPCADTLEVQRDALRIAVLHRQAGWFQAAVAPRYMRASNGVRILFAITAGTPATIDTIHIDGLPLRPTGGTFDGPLRYLQGRRFDRVRVDSSINEVLGLLRDAGYARVGRPENAIAIDSAAAKASLTLRFAPGLRTRLGVVSINVQHLDSLHPRVDSADVARIVRLRPGQRFRATGILNAQRALYRTDAFRLVLIDTLTSLAAGKDSLIDLRIGVAEAPLRTARVGLGWATQDCIRAQGRISDRGFLGLGRRVELSARASKIGIGAPADFAPSLCASALRNDPFSAKLNYYVGSTISDTRLFGYALAPRVTVYSERRGEPYAYLRETTVGSVLDVTGQLDRRTTITTGFQYEDGRTITDPVISCERFAQCRPEDYALNFFGRGLGIISTSVSHDRANDATNPSSGSRLRGELRAGQTFSTLVSSLRFYKGSVDAAVYQRLFKGVVAMRVQFARAIAPGAELVDGSPLIPQQERLFAGGQNSVRGFQQNLLGPLVYVVDTVIRSTSASGAPIVEAVGTGYKRAVPRGGTALLVANVEWRRPVRWLSSAVQVAAFVDAGNVWEGGSSPFRWSDMRMTPGLGLRLTTPVGPFRVDVGYSPYAPIAGRALYFTSKDANGNNGTIQCATPGNSVSIDATNPGSIFDCPSTFQPAGSKTLLSRLVFHFGLGQAF
jgi:outer membrane protein insertion porin family/translocation and assembly module TamA